MRKTILAFVDEQQALLGSLNEKLPMFEERYKLARCVSKAIGHTCGHCAAFFDCMAGISWTERRIDKALALVAVLPISDDILEAIPAESEGTRRLRREWENTGGF